MWYSVPLRVAVVDGNSSASGTHGTRTRDVLLPAGDSDRGGEQARGASPVVGVLVVLGVVLLGVCCLRKRREWARREDYIRLATADVIDDAIWDEE